MKRKIASMLLALCTVLGTSACGTDVSSNIVQNEADTVNQMPTETTETEGTESEDIEDAENTAVNNNSDCMRIAKYDWGTHRDVIAGENITSGMVAGTDYGEYDNELIFDDTVLNHHMGVHYEFDKDDALISTMFVMSEPSADVVYVNAFLEFLDEYTQLFGEYDFVTDASVIDRIISDPGAYAAGITNEDAVQVKWTNESDNSMLNLRLVGDQGYADLIIMYTCPGYFN